MNISDKRIFLFSWGQLEGESSNMGDKALFISLIDELKKKSPKSIITISNNVFKTKEKYNVDAIFYRNPLSIINAIYKSDLIILGGGEYIQDKSSFLYLIFNLFVPFLCNIFNKPVFAWGIGVGNFEELSVGGRFLTYNIFKRYKLITVRDYKSKISLIKIGIKRENIKVTADPVLSLKKSQFRGGLPKDFVIICPRDVFLRNRGFLPISIRKRFRLYPKSYLETRNKFIIKMIEYIDYIISETNLNVIVLPVYTGKLFSTRDDLFSFELMKRFKNTFKLKIINENLSPREIISIIEQSEFLVSVPLHGLILSTISSTPMISLTYSSKSEEFLKRLSMEKFSLNVYIFDVEKLKNLSNDILDNYAFYVKKISKGYRNLQRQNSKNLEFLEKYL